MARTNPTVIREATHGDWLLFKKAKRALQRAINALDEYDAYATALVKLGYGRDPDEPREFGPPSDFDEDTFPTDLRIEAWGCFIGSANVLNAIWNKGPQPRGAHQRTQRTSAIAARRRLGKETNWTCHYCEKQGTELTGPDNRAWHVDHVYPIADGGDNEPDNLVLACATCNLEKRAKRVVTITLKENAG